MESFNLTPIKDRNKSAARTSINNIPEIRQEKLTGMLLLMYL